MSPNRESKGALENLASLMKALSHPIRIKILALCAERERTNRELRELLGISKPLLILHLKELIRNGLLDVRAELDKDRLVIRKLYRTADIDICINPDFFRKLMDEEGQPST